MKQNSASYSKRRGTLFIFLIASVFAICFDVLAKDKQPGNEKQVKEAQARYDRGDLKFVANFCATASARDLELFNNTKYRGICHESSESYADLAVFSDYQKMMNQETEISANQMEIAQELWHQSAQYIDDPVAADSVSKFFQSPQSIAHEYRVFHSGGLIQKKSRAARPSPRPHHYRAHFFALLRNPELSATPIWLKKAKHPAVWNPDGSRPMVIERWYKERGSFHRAVANAEGRLIGTITLDPNRKVQIYLLDLDGDRVVDIASVIGDHEEKLMVRPWAMHFIEQWRAGRNILCGAPSEGGPIGSSLLADFAGDSPPLSPAPPPSINGCSLSPGGGGGMGSMPLDFDSGRGQCDGLQGIDDNQPSPGQGFMASLCNSMGHSIGGGGRAGLDLVAQELGRAPCYVGAPCHLDPPEARRGDVMDIFDDDGFGELSEAEARRIMRSWLISESSPPATERPPMSGGCADGLCDSSGDGVVDSLDTDSDGSADASCDPCSTNETNVGTSGTSQPISPEGETGYSAYCANLGDNYHSDILAICLLNEADNSLETGCDDPVINPNPRIKAIGTFSAREAESVSASEAVTERICAKTPGRSSVIEKGCPGGNPLASPISPGNPVPCLIKGGSGGLTVSLDVMFGFGLAFEFCDPRFCTPRDELLQLGLSGYLRTDQF